MRSSSAGIAFLTAALAAPSIAQSPTTASGVYTTAQAVRGGVVYVAHCRACHGGNLQGSEAAPPLVGAQFAENWRGQTLKELFARIRTMPPANPVALSRAEVADVLAYLLQADGHPDGETELLPGNSYLDTITIVPGGQRQQPDLTRILSTGQSQ